jgi:hypothetical protein
MNRIVKLLNFKRIFHTFRLMTILNKKEDNTFRLSTMTTDFAGTKNLKVHSYSGSWHHEQRKQKKA